MAVEPMVAADPTQSPISNFSKLAGLGYRPLHFSDLMAKPTSLSWLEIISENYVGVKGPRLNKLLQLAERYQLAIHGVSLNLGSPDPLNEKYLHELKKLIEVISPIRVSDHLCWTGSGKHNYHDLFPLPYTRPMLAHIAAKVERVQDFLQRPLLIENLSAYLAYPENDYDEYEFMTLLCQKTGCKILFDVNNLYVNATNLGINATETLRNFPVQFIEEIHLAGHIQGEHFLIDTHSRPVKADVWQLFQYLQAQKAIPFCLEWDNDIPKFEVVLNELQLAQNYLPKPKIEIHSAGEMHERI